MKYPFITIEQVSSFRFDNKLEITKFIKFINIFYFNLFLIFCSRLLRAKGLQQVYSRMREGCGSWTRKQSRF